MGGEASTIVNWAVPPNSFVCSPAWGDHENAHGQDDEGLDIVIATGSILVAIEFEARLVVNRIAAGHGQTVVARWQCALFDAQAHDGGFDRAMGFDFVNGVIPVVEDAVATIVAQVEIGESSAIDQVDRFAESHFQFVERAGEICQYEARRFGRGHRRRLLIFTVAQEFDGPQIDDARVPGRIEPVRRSPK